MKDVEDWYVGCVEGEQMKISTIPLSECRGWTYENGKIQHDTGEFFEVTGLRVSKSANREVGISGWDQPVIKQVGFDGGILGLVRKRFNGIPHYLVEAKAEPGNPNLVQISPTLQATFSNIKKAHKGKKPNYVDFFEQPDKYHAIIHYKQWLSEDGGRFYNKRNLNMLIELPEEYVIALKNDNFIWMSMFQIKQCLSKDAWVSPHIRGIISHI